MKKNCWEFKNCQQLQDPAHQNSAGLCPAFLEAKLDGVHGGKNGGRSCWAVAGTMCNGDLEGSYYQKKKNCTECEFYQSVMAEEGEEFTSSDKLIRLLFH